MNLMNAQEAWDMGQRDYNPCDDHEHCEMCGVCETEVELVQERWVPESRAGLGISVIDYPYQECLPCRAKGLAEDCGREIES